jgi:hypothetical protein
MSVFSARLPALALVVTSCLSSACDSDEPAPLRGSPVLTQVYWVAGGTAKLVWSFDPDVKLDQSVPPSATEIDFVFDRRLNGDRIEDRFTDGGVVMTRPKAMPPITASWPDKETHPGEPPQTLAVAYNSTARFAPDSSYVFARPLPAGFPSDTLVTFTLDLANLASEYGEAAVAPETIPVRTAPFAVTIAAPPGSVATNYAVPVVFSNRLAGAATVAPFVRVTTAAGGAVPSKVLGDANSRERIFVVPAECLGAWPAGAKLTVTVDKGTPDAFGRPLEVAGTGTFQTSAAGAIPDASCAIGDGGVDAVPDAPPEAPQDAPVMDAADGGAADADAAADTGPG